MLRDTLAAPGGLAAAIGTQVFAQGAGDDIDHADKQHQVLPQAGVALGMALTAQRLSDGEMVRNVVLFSVLVYELVGPALTKRALIAAGEIKTEGRTSARTKNAPAKPVHLGE